MNKIHSEYAPVVLFVYNRVIHTQKTVEALTLNQLANKTDIYIYSDACKNEKDREKVEEVREYIRTIPSSAFNSIHIMEQKENKGLANSVIAGVTDIVNKYGKVIVLEDDLMTSTCFLEYMNNALDKYEGSSNVYSISGYSFFSEQGNFFDGVVVPKLYFLDYFCSWGWATWKDKWERFDEDAKGWEQLKNDEKLSYKFSFDGRRPDTPLLIQQMEDGIDSWALRWRWSIFANKGVVLFPNKTMVKNIGWDGSGVHGAGGDPNRKIVLCNSFVAKYPKKIKEKYWIRKQLVNMWKPSIPRRVLNKIKRIYIKP